MAFMRLVAVLHDEVHELVEAEEIVLGGEFFAVVFAVEVLHVENILVIWIEIRVAKFFDPRYTAFMVTFAFVGVSHIHTPGFIEPSKSGRICGLKAYGIRSWPRPQVRAEEVGATVAKDFASIYADPEIDAVVIVYETKLHEQLVLPAVAAKKLLRGKATWFHSGRCKCDGSRN